MSFDKRLTNDPQCLLSHCLELAKEKRTAQERARKAFENGASAEELQRFDGIADAKAAELRWWLSNRGRPMGVFVEA